MKWLNLGVMNFRVIGLTGGIASGKSYVSSILGSLVHLL